LNWKYVEQPGQQLVRIAVSVAGKERAVGVLAIREPDQVYAYRRAHVLDVIVPTDDARLQFSVWESLRRVALERNADALLFHLTNPVLEASIKSFGFMKREATRYLLVNPETLSEPRRMDLLQARNWLLTQGDSDIDRPW
jgi:hypothetical protein